MRSLQIPTLSSPNIIKKTTKRLEKLGGNGLGFLKLHAQLTWPWIPQASSSIYPIQSILLQPLCNPSLAQSQNTMIIMWTKRAHHLRRWNFFYGGEAFGDPTLVKGALTKYSLKGDTAHTCHIVFDGTAKISCPASYPCKLPSVMHN